MGKPGSIQGPWKSSLTQSLRSILASPDLLDNKRWLPGGPCHSGLSRNINIFRTSTQWPQQSKMNHLIQYSKMRKLYFCAVPFNRWRLTGIPCGAKIKFINSEFDSKKLKTLMICNRNISCHWVGVYMKKWLYAWMWEWIWTCNCEHVFMSLMLAVWQRGNDAGRIW